jgi:hypothetical protein
LSLFRSFNVRLQFLLFFRSHVCEENSVPHLRSVGDYGTLQMQSPAQVKMQVELGSNRECEPQLDVASGQAEIGRCPVHGHRAAFGSEVNRGVHLDTRVLAMIFHELEAVLGRFPPAGELYHKHQDSGVYGLDGNVRRTRLVWKRRNSAQFVERQMIPRRVGCERETMQ